MRPEWAGYTSVLAFISFRKKIIDAQRSLKLGTLIGSKVRVIKRLGCIAYLFLISLLLKATPVIFLEFLSSES